MQFVLGISGSGCGAVGLWVAACAGWLVYALFLWSCSTRRLWKRMWAGTAGSTSLIEQSAVKKKLPVCVFHIKLRACLHPRLVFLTCSDSPAGDLWADSGRETTHRRPQSGQEGAFFQPPTLPLCSARASRMCHKVQFHLQISHFLTLLSAVDLYSFLTFATRCTMSPCWSWTSWRRVSLERSLGHWTPSFLSIKVNTH